MKELLAVWISAQEWTELYPGTIIGIDYALPGGDESFTRPFPAIRADVLFGLPS